ncbi:MAG: hypothetical protein ACLTMH_10640 [Faecalimonas umbilicata]|uniref:hypothetical protein n=1 Tax=Faecalimonas umbilicata TaxID=1912855 RepID=UPI003995B2B1
MENRIVTAVFGDSNTAKVSDVWQWDYGQILRIQGLDLPTAVEVDFAVAGASESIARIGTTKDGVTDVVIPDSLIETGKNLVAYIYLRDSASGNTEYQIDMIVTKRAKPEAYDTPEDKELFGQAIEAVNAAADRAEKARQTAQEAAQKAGLDAEQTAQDRVEVAKMVETVTDISEQVKKVEELSNKAQESATQAGASAAATEKAKAQVETAVGKTAEDRIAVNQAKIAVDEVQKEVRADRAAVEEVKQSVEQLSNAIPESTQAGVQAVNQAKQTAVDEIARTGISHKTAVEGAGTQAVENVENVKASATEAVETAKTEAVQSVQTEGNTQTGNVTTEGTKQVEAVRDEGQKVLQSIPEDFQTQMETKLNKQQGIENKGKVLVIGEDGNVAPGEVQSGGGDGIAIINTMSGESPLVIPDSAERVNKRLELVGKTEQNQDPPPSPEYPQEIKNSGKWNEETQKYEVDVKITGKNLLNLQKEPDVKGTYQGWKVGNGELLTLGVKDKGNNADIKGCYIGFSDQGSESNGVVWVVDNGVIKANPLNQRKAYVSIFPANETTVKKLTDRFDIQCELGNVATPYQPYKEQTITLTSDRQITKWDRLVEQDGQIGWLYQSNTVVIDGSETWSSSNVPDHIYFTTTVNNKSGRINTSLCKTYKNNGEPVFNKKHEGEYNIYSDHPTNGVSDTAFVPPNETVTTIPQWKEWLNANPIEMLYKTKTTEFIPLPQSEQNAIRALKTYYPTTVITADGGELDPDIKVTYTADTKNYIDNKVSAKVASIIRQYRLNTASLLSLMPMETQAAMIENDTNNILENAEEIKHE